MILEGLSMLKILKPLIYRLLIDPSTETIYKEMLIILCAFRAERRFKKKKKNELIYCSLHKRCIEQRTEPVLHIYKYRLHCVI